ncbi:MAG: peptide deformylase [Patescibacteria group bacterium]
MVDIVQKENHTLRGKAGPVAQADFGSEKLHEIIARMSDALSGENDGVAIAAPQIGIPLRIFVISGKVLRKKRDGSLASDRVFINPEIVNTAQKKEWMEEGCLSVRWQYGEVERFIKATVRAHDVNGKAFTLGGGRLLSHIFQHEIDHLNGILFIDKARNVKEMHPNKPHYGY